MNEFKNFTKVGVLYLMIAIVSLGQAGVVRAAVDSTNLYLYDFQNATTTIANLAGTTAPITLTGNWSSSATGATFAGNTLTQQSVGYAKPASGSTLNIAATEAVGAAVIFNQSGGCKSDSQNISQVGLFAANTAQIKLQLSKCVSSTKMYPECRIAGALTAASVLALRGTVQLASGTQYRLECVKSADAGTSATVTMRTTNIATSQTTIDTFSIAATGAIASTKELSVGNKYPMPAVAKNTDQFTGTVTKVGYCKGTTIATTQACLSEGVALAVTPGPEKALVDEVKYAYGSTKDQVVFSWRGAETTLYYGLTTAYGMQATASPSAITPVDTTGPFMEATLSGLQTGTTYHYKIGSKGTDYVFTTVAGTTDSFKAVSIGDTIASTCRSYQSVINQQVSDQRPNFVLHGGDLAIANECGQSAVHQYYLDIENSFSRSAAFMPVWGNHEYGQPTEDAPAGTPRDTLANYKGRSAIPNPQTVPNDTATQTGHPGCGSDSGSSVNTCRGEDWGWFVSGRVLFVSFPDVWPGAITDWYTKVNTLMANAQANPDIDYIVTYGHRPVLSSTTWTAPDDYETVFGALGDAYSPTSRADGKYVLNLTQHRHSMEVFSAYHGVMQIVNGGGGQGLINFGTILPDSVFRMKHLGFSTLAYDAVNRTLTYQMICGPSTTGETTTCTVNDVMYSHVFERPSVETAPASLAATVTDAATSRQAGETYTYTATVTNSGAQEAADVSASVTVPSGLGTIVSAPEGTTNGQTVAWQLGTLAAGQTAQRTVAVKIASTAENNMIFTTALQVTSSTGTACDSSSSCYAEDNDTITVPIVVEPTTLQLVKNQGIETDLTGWTGKYGSSSFVTVARSTEAAYAGTGSIKVTGLAGANNLSSGFNDNSTLVTSSQAGVTYTGSVWLKAGSFGQSIVLRLREWDGTTLLTDNKVTYTASTTGWTQVTGSITPVKTGTRLAFIVYASDLDAGEYFYADTFSFTRPL